MKRKWYEYLPTLEDVIVLNLYIGLIVGPIILLIMSVKFIINLFK